MKTNEIMKSVSLTFNKVGFQLQKKIGIRNTWIISLVYGW